VCAFLISPCMLHVPPILSSSIWSPLQYKTCHNNLLQGPDFQFISSNDTQPYKPILKAWYRTLQLSNWLPFVRFQILTAESMKMAVFWGFAPCSLVEGYRRFRGPCCLWNVSKRLPNYTAQQPKRQPSSAPLRIRVGPI
jgi:hypothetical protein